MVTVLDASGQPRPRARVRIAGPPSLAARAQLLRGRAPSNESADSAAPRTFLCDGDGVLELAGFDAGEELELVLVDPLGNGLASRRVRADEDGASVELQVPAGLPSFRGAVEDELGRPLVGGALVLTAPSGASWRLRTDREGNFLVGHGQRGPVRVEVSKAGFDTLTLDGVDISAAQPHAYVLRSAD